LGADGVLLLPEGILKLSETGLKIVALCDGARTVAQIVESIQTEYTPSLRPKIREDVHAYLAKLADKKAVDLG
jgi:pyrroloquinoline quinone biosynthesis protein D